MQVIWNLTSKRWLWIVPPWGFHHYPQLEKFGFKPLIEARGITNTRLLHTMCIWDFMTIQIRLITSGAFVELL